MKKGSAKKQKSTPKPPRRRVSIVSTGGASGGGQTPSAVWKFFLKQQDKQSSKCSLCGQIISLSSSSTSSMWRHLKSEHPPEFQQARSVLIGGNHLVNWLLIFCSFLSTFLDTKNPKFFFQNSNSIAFESANILCTYEV